MMDITEYWATLVSIVIGLGVADVLVNLHRLTHERKRVSWDALPLRWAVVALAWMLNYWWAVAMNLEGSRNARTAGEFALLAVPPIFLFLSSASVLPRSMPAAGRLYESGAGQFALGVLRGLRAEPDRGVGCGHSRAAGVGLGHGRHCANRVHGGSCSPAFRETPWIGSGSPWCSP